MQISFIICGMVSGIILFQSVLIAPAINKLIDQKQASTLLRHLWPKFFLTIGLLSLLSFVTSLLFPTDQILTKYSSSLSFVLMSICYFMVPIINNAKDSSKNRLWSNLHLTTVILTLVTLLLSISLIYFNVFSYFLISKLFIQYSHILIILHF